MKKDEDGKSVYSELKVKKIYSLDKESTYAFAGQALTIQLDREVDVSRGCVFVKDKKLQYSVTAPGYSTSV